MDNKVTAINNRILDLKKKLKKSKAGAYRDELLQEVFDLRKLKKEVTGQTLPMTAQEILDFEKAFDGIDKKMDDFKLYALSNFKEMDEFIKKSEVTF
jgi:hypothetical protein